MHPRSIWTLPPYLECSYHVSCTLWKCLFPVINVCKRQSYAVLGGFGGLIGKPTPTASMSVSTVGSPSSGGYYELTFTSVSSNISLVNTQLKITTASGTTTAYSFVPASTSPTTSNGTYGTTPVAYAGNSGEYLTFNTVITVHAAASLSAIYLIDTQTGGTIASATNL